MLLAIPMKGNRVPVLTAYGNWSDTGAGAYGAGGGYSVAAWGIRFTPAASGSITQVKQQVFAVPTAFSVACKVYTDSSGNPGSQVGSDSSTVSLTPTGEKTWIFSSPVSVTGGTPYWFTWVDGSGTGQVDLFARADNAAYGSKRGATLGAMSDLASSIEWRTEYVLET